MKLVEQVQRRATNWILNYIDLSYGERLTNLNILPLSLHLQICDILTFSKLLSGSNSDIWQEHIQIYEPTHYGSRSLTIFKLPKLRLENSRSNFWFRTARLFNLLPSSVNVIQPKGLKDRTLTFFWEYFKNHWMLERLCTWRFECMCKECREKLF